MLFEVFLFGNVLCVASFSSSNVGQCCDGSKSWDCDEHSMGKRVCEQVHKGEKKKDPPGCESTWLEITGRRPRTCFTWQECSKRYECCDDRYTATCAGKKGGPCYHWLTPLNEHLDSTLGQYHYTGGQCESVLKTAFKREWKCEKGDTHEMRCRGAAKRFAPWTGEPTSSHTTHTTHLPMAPSSFTHPSSHHTRLFAIF